MTSFLQKKAMYYAQQQNAIPTDGLVCYMPLSEDIEDKTGNKVVRNVTTSPTSTSTGNENLRFGYVDGIPCMTKIGGRNDYTLSRGSLDLPTNSDDVTISLWVRVSSDLSSIVRVLRYSSYSASGGDYFGLRVASTGGFALDVYSGTAPVILSGTSVIREKWYNVCIMDRNGKRYGYVDGEQKLVSTIKKKLTSDVNTNYNYGSLWVMVQSVSTELVNLASVRIYDRILTQAEITALAHEFNPTTKA